MKIKICSGSTCDLSKELIEKYNISIMPLTVVLGDKTCRDGIDVSAQDIFNYVKATGNLPKTAAPSIGEYQDFFEKEIQGYDALIYFEISSGASGSYNYACQGAAEVKNVYVIDSHQLSSGQGLLVLKACDLAAQGMDVKAVVNTIEGLKDNVNTSFIPDVLDYLHKGGRCSLGQLIGAKVLKLHPMIAMKEGKLYAKKKYMGSLDKSIRTYIKELAAEYPSYDKTRCFITHSSCERETVEKAIALVKETFNFDEVLETVAGSVVTSHCGKNTLGVLFIHD